MKDNEFSINNQPEEENDSTPKSTFKHRKLIISLASVAIILPLAIYGILQYNDAKDQEHQENLDLAVLCEENYNIEDYQLFLEKYPESQHFQEVNARKTELENMATIWDSIRNSKKASDFISFKQQYSDSHYTRLCNNKLDSIDWSAAQKTNTPDGYQAYINNNPNGLYVSEAIIAKGEVGYMNLTEIERSNIRDICNQFFTAIGVNHTDSARFLLAADMERFMQLKSPTHEDVVEWINNNQKDCSLKTYIVKDSIKSQRAFNAETGISYISNLNIEQITTDNDGNEKKEPLEAIVKQNRKFQIYSVTIKETQL